MWLASLLFLFLISLPDALASHQWVPVESVGQHRGGYNRWTTRRLLYSLRMSLRGGRTTPIPKTESPAVKVKAVEQPKVKAPDSNSRWESRLPIFVIGLKHREEERLAKFLLKLRWYQDLHVVDAVDGRTVDPTEKMTSGEIGCFESHRKAWKRVVDEEVRQAIIMEDDADVDLSLHMKKVAAFVAEAPSDWQVLYLGINNDKDIRNVTATVAEPVHYIMGTHAYVIKMSVAARLHALSEKPPYKDVYKPVDMWLTEQGLKIYVINPPLVKQRNFGDTDTQGIRVKTLNATRLLL